MDFHPIVKSREAVKSLGAKNLLIWLFRIRNDRINIIARSLRDWGRVKNLSDDTPQWAELITPYGDGTDTSRRRLFLRLQATPLPFFGVPWMNFTHTLSCLNCTKNLKGREQVKPQEWYWGNKIHRNVGHLLIWNIDIDMVSVSWSSTNAMKFGDDLNQSITAQQEVTFGCRCRTLKRDHSQ